MSSSLLTLCSAHLERRIEVIDGRLASIDPVGEPAALARSGSTVFVDTIKPATVPAAPTHLSTAYVDTIEPDVTIDTSVETLTAPDSDDLWDCLEEPSTFQIAATLTSTSSRANSTDPSISVAASASPSDVDNTSPPPTSRVDNTSTPYYREAIHVLKNTFRLSSFRHNQLEAINATLDGKDVFVLMPTGGGKSLCYQLPAVCKSGRTQGVTFVVSPLVALIADQVASLREKNINVDCMSSLRSADDSRDVMRRLRSQQKPDICYITPEKLRESNAMQEILASLYEDKQIARFVIDEAHVIQSWGRDFRDAVSLSNLISARADFFLTSLVRRAPHVTRSVP